MNIKKMVKFVIDHYFISIFAFIIIIVGFFSFFKIFYSQASYVYVKVKLGQGLWWAGGQKPSSWFVNAIKKGDIETDLLGRPIAEVLSVRYYPFFSSDQFDVYLTVKLKVSNNKRTNKYNFKRSAVGVSSPIELELSKVNISGTIIDLNEQRFNDKYIDKTVFLTKKYAYPWEFEAIKIGDKYFDGEEIVFEIIGKNATDNNQIITTEFERITNPRMAELRKYIVVKAKLKVREIDGQLIFGGEQKINVGKNINISTPNFTFDEYAVGSIE